MKRYQTAFVAMTTLFVMTTAVTLTLPRPAESRQTQFEMDEQAGKEYTRADAELNRVYKKLMAKLDATGAAKLKKAQRAWIAYRDAEKDFSADYARGGTMASMLATMAAADLTRQRTKILQSALEQYRSR